MFHNFQEPRKIDTVVNKLPIIQLSYDTMIASKDSFTKKKLFIANFFLLVVTILISCCYFVDILFILCSKITMKIKKL